LLDFFYFSLLQSTSSTISKLRHFEYVFILVRSLLFYFSLLNKIMVWNNKYRMYRKYSFLSFFHFFYCYVCIPKFLFK